MLKNVSDVVEKLPAELRQQQGAPVPEPALPVAEHAVSAGGNGRVYTENGINGRCVLGHGDPGSAVADESDSTGPASGLQTLAVPQLSTERRGRESLQVHVQTQDGSRWR